MHGVIVVDKPEGWTSHDVVNKIRRIAGTRRVGHLGTLDPMATGVLPLVVGRATRLAQFYSRNDKRYDAVICFGFATDTYDRDGVPQGPVTEPVLDPAEIENILAPFRGAFSQTPPPVSAKKIDGVPAYRLTRKGKAPVKLDPVEVTVFSLKLLECAGSRIRIDAHCSAGTYLRSIAHEAGRAIGCGAHLEKLRRTQSGDFYVDAAHTIPDLEKLAVDGRLEEALIPAAELLPQFPAEHVDALTAGQIRQGRDFRVSPFRATGNRYVKAIGQDGDLIAIGEVRLPHVYHPILVLAD
jgi:tRNA pseudouridine55 synthase